jgi:hypothetical protein
MTNAQLYKAMENNKYIVVTNRSGTNIGVNCKIALKLQIDKAWETNPNYTSFIQGFYPCSFQEYITKKIGYL